MKFIAQTNRSKKFIAQTQVVESNSNSNKNKNTIVFVRSRPLFQDMISLASPTKPCMNCGK
jgi:hypothetical protein